MTIPIAPKSVRIPNLEEFTPSRCPCCGEKEGLTWDFTTRNTSSVNDGRLRMHEVRPGLMLYCEISGDTLMVIEDFVDLPAEFERLSVRRPWGYSTTAPVASKFDLGAEGELL